MPENLGTGLLGPHSPLRGSLAWPPEGDRPPAPQGLALRAPRAYRAGAREAGSRAGSISTVDRGTLASWP